ncbi:hypothetical protein MAMP_01387 [Methylophaga aminisulfidivorans MP]|jgi:hypothetical protein|uniref:Uncharacterized protein n=1 Tax=Methylophaga aminisulfidivorans MP TaxID=1026882 RepID=F5T3B7_9GAMM|nr:hypothetical protein MAMP_01387 [Methylophaga aminisulfidivorans MP]
MVPTLYARYAQESLPKIPDFSGNKSTQLKEVKPKLMK